MTLIKVPQPVTNIITVREFKSRFLPGEYRAISVLTQTDDIVFQLWGVLDSEPNVDLELKQVKDGMAYLVGIGAITEDRHDEIMA